MKALRRWKSSTRSRQIPVIVIFRCAAQERSCEAIFLLSDTVQVMKDRVESLFSLDSSSVCLVFRDKVLSESEELSRIFKRGGFVNDLVDVRIENEEKNEKNKKVVNLGLSLDQDGQAQILAPRIQEMGFKTEAAQMKQEPTAALEPYNSSTEAADIVLSCPVCMDEFPESQTISFLCSIDQEQVDGESKHFLCYDCATSHVEANIGNPTITCYAPGCKHVLMPQEIALVLGHGNLSEGMKTDGYTRIDEAQRDHAIARDPQDFAACPSPTCDWIVARSSKGAMEKATCPQCKLAFCTNCNDIYHYRCTCVEWQQLRRAWQDWIVSGRSEYWKHNKGQLQKAQKAATAEQRRVRQVREIEARDEQYKADNCRYCPHCNRLVERLEGCSIMRCGYDTDTQQNRQHGCLQRFDWNTAKPYVAAKVGENVKYEAHVTDKNKPQHVGETCDRCKTTEIRGLLFECVNCPFFKLCETCEVDIGKDHIQGHVFAIKQL